MKPNDATFVGGEAASRAGRIYDADAWHDDAASIAASLVPLSPFAPELEAAPTLQPRSLFAEILDWMLAPLLLVWPMSIVATYLVAASIANAPFDQALETGAIALAAQVGMAKGTQSAALPTSLPIVARDILRAGDSGRVYFQVRGARGKLLNGDAQIPPPPEDDAPAPGLVQFRNATVGGEDVRIAWMLVDTKSGSGDRTAVVQVAETLGKRAHLANEIIKGVILPQFVILPIAVALAWFGLSRGIRPLARLQDKIAARSESDMRPIDPREAPDEVAPLVLSFNQLLGRIKKNSAEQKRFIADAAHQMKTPLAGLRTQAELALRERDPAELQRCLEQLVTGSTRATRLIDQLLALARAEHRGGVSGDAAALAAIDLDSLARDAMREWVPAALDKRIDFGLETTGAPARVVGNALLIGELIKNLIDNAIRYTPAGGAVTVRVSGITGPRGSHPARHETVLQVEDNGPGIAPAERGIVFERFYRVLGSGVDGSGLGLAIVREIAEQHGATVHLGGREIGSDSRVRPGLVVSVRFPTLPHST